MRVVPFLGAGEAKRESCKNVVYVYIYYLKDRRRKSKRATVQMRDELLNSI